MKALGDVRRGSGVLGLALAALAVLATGETQAATWYVDAVGGNDSASGAMVTAARKTLAGAMGIAALEDGDTIVLLPGTYDSESMSREGEGIAARAVVTKSVTIRSLQGRATRDATVIGGVRPQDGVAAVRGLLCAADVTIEGVTFSNCWSQTTGSMSQATSGGGVSALPGTTVRAVDCRFTQCGAVFGGAMSFGYDTNLADGFAARCEFDACSAIASGSAVWRVPLYYCYLHDFSQSVSKTAPVCNQDQPSVNCTFLLGRVADDEKLQVAASGGPFLNCVLINPSAMGSDVVCTNLVYNYGAGEKCVDSRYVAARTMYLSLNTGDLRLQPGSGIQGAGNAAFLEQIPEALRLTDFYGAAVAVTDGTVSAGCSTLVGTVDGGAIDFDESYAFRLNGVPMAELNYMTHYTSDRKQVLRVEPLVAAGERVFCIEDKNSGKRYYPNRDGVIELTVPDSGTLKVGVVKAKAVLQVGAGQAYATIQDAVDAAEDLSVIEVTKGTYATGGRNGSRVTIPADKSLILMSVDGAAETVIVGQADAAQENGLGADAVRCLEVLSPDCVIDGFTLQGGHTAADGIGGGVYAAATSVQVRNCVITGCWAYRGGGAYSGSLRGCVLQDCVATNLAHTAFNSNLTDSFLDGGWGCWQAVYGCGVIRGCTFGANLHGTKKTSTGAPLGKNVGNPENTLILCGGKSDSALAPVNCAAVASFSWNGSDTSDCVEVPAGGWNGDAALIGMVDAGNPATGRGIGCRGEDWSAALPEAWGTAPAELAFDLSSATTAPCASGMVVTSGSVTTGVYAGKTRRMPLAVIGDGTLVARENGRVVAVVQKADDVSMRLRNGCTYELAYYPAAMETTPGFVLTGSVSDARFLVIIR